MTEPTEPPAQAAPPRCFETRHGGCFHGTEIAYSCRAAETRLPDAKGDPHASIFSFSYLADSPAPETRPVTFAFNGGPGSASLWLHMGALGPRRIVLPGDPAAPAAAPSIIDNALCCLDRTDLVFIDPPGTGYSRMLGAAKPEDAWGVEPDADIVAAFVKTWLTANRRWASPRFLCGESYGTTRAIAVAGTLAGKLNGVAFDGIALISPILDFHTARIEPGNPLADACFLPTCAATAHYHGLVNPAPPDRDAFLAEARRFAVEEYLPALFAGTRLAAPVRQRVRRRLARMTGVSEAWLDRTRLRLDPARYRKELLRARGLTVGRFDTRYTGTDYDDAGDVPDADASSYAIDAAYVAAMNDLLTRTLQIDWDRPYTVFNHDALAKWDWLGPRKDGAGSRWPGYVNVAPTLGRLLRENPALRVLMACGLYDLATPFAAAEATIAGNGIDTTRIRVTTYDAGHMMYLHDPSLTALVADLRALIG